MQEVLSRIREGFFPIMAPGFYVFLSIFVPAVFLSNAWGNTDVWDSFLPVLQKTNQFWALTAMVIFSSYLFGKIVRAVTVSSAERIGTKLLGPLFLLIKTINVESDQFAQNKKQENPFDPDEDNELESEYDERMGFDRRFWGKTFPYHGHWEYVIEKMKVNGKALNYKMPNEGTFHFTFNQYKSLLCIEAPEAFYFVQGYEYTSRLFAGMFWASAFGVLLFSLMIIVYCVGTLVGALDISWLLMLFSFAAISLLMFCTFGIQLPRVRSREVEYLLLAYISLMESKDRD